MKNDKDDYEGFVDKFKPKLTTDDCYTPELVYDAVSSYVAGRYSMPADSFVRPFYPGKDYKAHPYKPDSVVVDNPPFSILSEIIDWYQDRAVWFFMFCPQLTCMGYTRRQGITVLPVGAAVEYANGAKVSTAFVTNLSPGIRAEACPRLYKAVTDAVLNGKAATALPKYEYPDEVATATRLHYIAANGAGLAIKASESCAVRGLDSQKPYGKSIFGSGLLLSEKSAQAQAQAQEQAQAQAQVHRWAISERERRIIKKLS